MMPETVSDGLSIRYGDTGERTGPALLCLHGWAAHRRNFDPLLPHLAGRVLTVDFRGHGESDSPAGDYGEEELVRDALAVVAASGAEVVVPLAVAHSGWVALELVRRLGPSRVPAVVLLDWIVLDAPPPFLGALEAMARGGDACAAARDGLLAMWTEGVDNPGAVAWVRHDMAAAPLNTWRLGGRAIGAAYARHGSPLNAFAALDAPPRVLHLYAQPADPGYLDAQRAFAAAHPWFTVERLDGARSHFPQYEVPDAIAARVNALTALSNAAQPV